MWEGKPTCGKPVCEISVTRKPLSTAIHDTLNVCVAFVQGAHSGAGSSAGVEDAWASLNTAVESTLVSIQSLVKEGETPYWGFVAPLAPSADGVPATDPALKATAAAADGAAAEGDTAMGDGSDEDEDEVEVINVAAESGVCGILHCCTVLIVIVLSFGVAPSLAHRFQLASACALPSSRLLVLLQCLHAAPCARWVCPPLCAASSVYCGPVTVGMQLSSSTPRT